MTRGPNSDIQAVILCGPGHSLDPLIDEESTPKALLPIANKPLLYYPITWLQQSGVTDIILVAPQSLCSRLTQLIKLHIIEGGSHISIVGLENPIQGTIEALRAVRPNLHSDFILLSCDLISEFPLYPMIDQHRTSNSLVTVMLCGSDKSAGKGEESNRHEDLEENQVYAGMDESRKKLLYLVGKADIEDSINFRMSLLSRYPCILLRTNLTDAHCYIFRKDFLEMFDSGLLMGKRNLFSIREELIPRMVKHQTIGPKSCSKQPEAQHRPSNTCAVRLVDGEFCVRVNNLKHYVEANRYICKNSSQSRVSSSADINQKSQIGNDSMVGDFSKTGEKTSVKKSIIGHNVSIGKNVKISNSIIMDKVIIEDNCKIDNCIISNGVFVGEKCTLKDCDVAPGYRIATESSLKGEILSNHDEL